MHSLLDAARPLHAACSPALHAPRPPHHRYHWLLLSLLTLSAAGAMCGQVPYAAQPLDTASSALSLQALQCHCRVLLSSPNAAATCHSLLYAAWPLHAVCCCAQEAACNFCIRHACCFISVTAQSCHHLMRSLLYAARPLHAARCGAQEAAFQLSIRHACSFICVHADLFKQVRLLALHALGDGVPAIEIAV